MIPRPGFALRATYVALEIASPHSDGSMRDFPYSGLRQAVQRSLDQAWARIQRAAKAAGAGMLAGVSWRRSDLKEHGIETTVAGRALVGGETWSATLDPAGVMKLREGGHVPLAALCRAHAWYAFSRQSEVRRGAGEDVPLSSGSMGACRGARDALRQAADALGADGLVDVRWVLTQERSEQGDVVALCIAAGTAIGRRYGAAGRPLAVTSAGEGTWR